MTNRYPGMIRVGRAALLAFGLVFVAMTQIGSTALGAEDAKKDRLAWQISPRPRPKPNHATSLLWIQFTGPWCVQLPPDGAGSLCPSRDRRRVTGAVRPGQASIG